MAKMMANPASIAIRFPHGKSAPELRPNLSIGGRPTPKHAIAARQHQEPPKINGIKLRGTRPPYRAYIKSAENRCNA